MPYDMVKNFTPIALIASAPNLLVVNNDLPVKNVSELVAYMKANPNKLSFGSPGIGTSVHVSGELFKSMTGTSMTHAPYKGRQYAIPGLVGGSIQLMFDNMPSALPMAREGKIRALAQTTAQRSSALPDVPTVAELGYPGFEANTWFAMMAPMGTPAEVLDRLNTEVNRILANKALVDGFAAQSLEAVRMDRPTLDTYLAAEAKKWAAVVQQTGAKVD